MSRRPLRGSWRAYTVQPPITHAFDGRPLGEAFGALLPGGFIGERGEMVVPANACAVIEKMLGVVGSTWSVEHRGGAERPPRRYEQILGSATPLNARAIDYISRTPYQAEGIERLAQLGDGVALWVPGAGKTLAAIALGLDGLSPRDHLLIVTRGGTKRHLAREVLKYTDGIEPRVLEGETPGPLDRSDPRNRVLVCGWEILHAWKAALVSLRPRKVIWDELHRGQGHRRMKAIPLQSGRTQFVGLGNTVEAAATIARVAEARIGLTATLVMDRPRNVWGQLDLVQPGRFGRYWREFAVRYCAAYEGAFGWVDTGRANLDELRMRVDAIAHWVDEKTAYRDLPPARLDVIRLPKDQLDRPSGGWKEILREAGRDPNRRFECQLMIAASMKRSYVTERAVEALASGQKVTVLTGRREDTDALGARIATGMKKALPDGVGMLWVGHGGFSEKVRDQMARDYMAHPGPACLVGTGYSFGEGMDLQDTDLALLPMLPWRPGEFKQWVGRFTRRGQRRAVLICPVLATGTADEAVASALMNKLPDVAAITGDNWANGVATALEGLRGHEEELLNSVAVKLAKDPDAVWEEGEGVR